MTVLRQGYGGQGLLLLAFMAVAATAFAQEAPRLRDHHVTLGGGVIWSGGYGVGESTAQLRGNAPGATAPPFTLFTVESRVTAAAAPFFRVGFAVTPALVVEGGVNYAQPRVGMSISRDAEAPAQELAGEKLEQYQIDAGLSWQIPMPLSIREKMGSAGSRLAPFASAGGAYLRQLHEDRALAETGQVYYAGGGARYWLRGGQGTTRDLGVRGDIRVNFRTGAIDFDNKTRIYPSVSLMLFVGL